MKNSEEFNAFKEEAVNKELAMLSDEDLTQVSGGAETIIGYAYKCNYCNYAFTCSEKCTSCKRCGCRSSKLFKLVQTIYSSSSN